MSGAFLIVLSAVGPAGMAVAMVVMGLLSKRLGSVTKIPPHYRWFYVAAGFLAVSTIFRLLAVGADIEPLALPYAVSLAIGTTIGLFAAWRYWGWLFAERN